MTRDEIIKALDWHAPTVERGPHSLLRRVEAVVAQAEAAEREACANVCEEMTASWTQPVYNGACMDCATAIRNRAEGEPK